MKDTVSSSSASFAAGSSPRTILQKMQSGTSVHRSKPSCRARAGSLRRARGRAPGLLASRDLAGVAGLGEVLEQLSDARPRAIPSSRESSSPRTSGSGGPRLRQRRAAPSNLSRRPCARRWPSPRALRAWPAGLRSSAASRPLGRARRPAGSGRRSARTAAGARARGNPPQVMAHQGRHVSAQPLARAQPSQDLAGELGCAQIVAEEGHPPVGARVAGEGLGDVVEKRSPAQGHAARQAVRERLLEQRADFLPCSSPTTVAGSACKARTRPSVSSVWPYTSR